MSISPSKNNLVPDLGRQTPIAEQHRERGGSNEEAPDLNGPARFIVQPDHAGLEAKFAATGNDLTTVCASLTELEHAALVATCEGIANAHSARVEYSRAVRSIQGEVRNQAGKVISARTAAESGWFQGANMQRADLQVAHQKAIGLDDAISARSHANTALKQMRQDNPALDTLYRTVCIAPRQAAALLEILRAKTAPAAIVHPTVLTPIDNNPATTISSVIDHATATEPVAAADSATLSSQDAITTPDNRKIDNTMAEYATHLCRAQAGKFTALSMREIQQFTTLSDNHINALATATGYPSQILLQLKRYANQMPPYALTNLKLFTNEIRVVTSHGTTIHITSDGCREAQSQMQSGPRAAQAAAAAAIQDLAPLTRRLTYARDMTLSALMAGVIGLARALNIPSAIAVLKERVLQRNATI